MQQDTGEDTPGHRLAQALAIHGLTSRSNVDRSACTETLAVKVTGGAEIWIAASTGDSDIQTNQHPGWIALYRPHGDRDDEEEAEVYRSEGTGGFTQDTAALVVAVVQYAAARSMAPA